MDDTRADFAVVASGAAAGQNNVAEVDQRSCDRPNRQDGVLQAYVVTGFRLFFEYRSLTEFGKTTSLGPVQQNAIFVTPGAKNYGRADLRFVNTSYSGDSYLCACTDKCRGTCDRGIHQHRTRRDPL